MTHVMPMKNHQKIQNEDKFQRFSKFIINLHLCKVSVLVSEFVSSLIFNWYHVDSKSVNAVSHTDAF